MASITQDCAAKLATHITEVARSGGDHYEHEVDQLIALLVQVGDLSFELAKSAWYEPQSEEHDCVDLFHDGGVTRVHLNGTIDQFPN